MPNEPTPAENAAAPATGAEENQDELSTEDEEFLANVDPDDVDDMTADELARLKEVLPKAKSAIKQKQHFRTKAENLEKELGSLKNPPAPAKSEEKVPTSKKDGDSAAEAVRFAKIEFKQDHPDLDKEAVEEIFAYAKAKNISPEESLNSSLIKAFLQDRKNREESEDASPHPSGGGSTMKSKPVDFARMPPKDFRAYRQRVLERSRLR